MALDRPRVAPHVAGCLPLNESVFITSRTPTPTPARTGRFRVRTFGGLSVEGRDATVLPPAALTQRKRLTFLALLAASGPRGIARDRLLLLLWPESTTEKARNGLYQLIYAARQAFGDDSIVGTDELRLDPAIVSSDVAEFQEALARDDSAGAVELYAGPFLDAVHISGSPELERWFDQRRHELARDYQNALTRLASEAMARREFATAVRYTERLVAVNQLSARATVMLMEALAASGDASAAIERARVHASVVRDELGTDVDPSVTALVARLRAGESTARQADVPGASSVGHDDSRTVATPSVTKRERRLPKWSLGGVAVALVAIAGGLALRRPPERSESVVVADAETAPGDSAIADILSMATRRALSGSQALRATPDSTVAAVRARLHIPADTRLTRSLARQVALGDSKRLVVALSLGHMEAGYALSMQLISAATGRTITSAERTGVGAKELIFTLDTLSRLLRQRAGDNAAAIRAQPSLPAMTSASLEAMSHYATAVRLPHGREDQAVAHLRQAVALDPSFAAAYLQLAFRLRGFPASRIERHALMDAAFALRSGLTEYERLLVESFYLYSPNGKAPNRERYVESWRDIVRKYPTAAGAVLLGSQYYNRREFAAAESTYRLAISLDSTNEGGFGGATAVLLHTGRVAEARRMVDEHAKSLPPSFMLWDAWTSYAEGRISRAGAVAARMASDSSTRASGLRVRAAIELLGGHLAESETDTRKADSISKDSFASSHQLGIAYWVRGRPADGLRYLDAVVAADSTSWRNLDVAEAYARLGRPDKARRILETPDSLLDGFLPLPVGRHEVLGWVYLAEERPESALHELRDSLRLPDGPVRFDEIATDPAIGLAFERMNRPDSAIVVYEHYLGKHQSYLGDDALMLAWVLEHVAIQYERKNDRAKARAAYSRFVDLWKTADPELQPRVDSARARIAALSR